MIYERTEKLKHSDTVRCASHSAAAVSLSCALACSRSVPVCVCVSESLCFCPVEGIAVCFSFSTTTAVAAAVAIVCAAAALLCSALPSRSSALAASVGRYRRAALSAGIMAANLIAGCNPVAGANGRLATCCCAAAPGRGCAS